MNKTLFALAALMLAGCVNVHVHFPAAPAEQGAGAPVKKPSP